MASASLPPALPTIKIGGEYYWDGGLVSNTPLQWVLDTPPRKDTLAFQVDLWSARGDLPRNFVESEVREKDILFSSQTRMATDQFKKVQILRRATAKLLAKMPTELLQTPEAETLAAEADEKVYNVIQLIYRKNYAGNFKDYEYFPEDNGGALEVGLQRCGAHLASPEGVASAQWPGRLLHL